jgi:hypothetical protein
MRPFAQASYPCLELSPQTPHPRSLLSQCPSFLSSAAAYGLGLIPFPSVSYSHAVYHTLTFLFRLSLMKTPRSSLLLMISSTSLCLITSSSSSQVMRPLKASIATHHHRPAAHERTPRRNRPCQREVNHYALRPTPSFSFLH